MATGTAVCCTPRSNPPHRTPHTPSWSERLPPPASPAPRADNITAADVQPSYRELLSANVSVLVYNGLRDTGVPAVGAEKWVPRVAGTALVEPRRKWGTPAQGGAFAGHVTAYASGLTFATVAGAGHLVPADRPVPALAMLSAFLQGEPLPAYQGAKCKRLWIGRGYGNFCGE